MTTGHGLPPPGEWPPWVLGILAGLVLSLGLTTVVRLRWRLVAVTVRGSSMEPTYREGDRVLVDRAHVLSVGQVVVVEGPVVAKAEQPAHGLLWRHPPVRPRSRPDAVSGRSWLIKRVAAVPGDPVPRDRVPALSSTREDRVPHGKVVLVGDNPDASFDSRQAGYFPAERLLGAVLRPLHRAPG
jgi:signal peptidase I